MEILFLVVFAFCLARLGVAVYNFASEPVLRVCKKRHNDLVSILVPARNEQESIAKLLDSVSLLDYGNFELIVLDDHSSDRTFEICESYAGRDQRFSVVRGQALPQGWLGKNHACHQLAQLAKGSFLLFLDADTTVHRQLLNAAVQRMHNGKLDLLSLFPDQQMESIGEKLVVPLMNYLLLTLLPIRLILKHPMPIFSAASGQFMLFRACCYKKHQFHMAVKADIAEDLSIMKLVKKLACKGQGLLAGGLVTCRMYNGYLQAVTGFSKNFLAPFGGKIWLFSTFLSLSVIGPASVMLLANPYLILALALTILLTRAAVSKVCGQSLALNIILHPFQQLSLAVVGYLAILGTVRRDLEWKGRKISFAESVDHGRGVAKESPESNRIPAV